MRLVTLPWQAVREGVDVKLLPQDQELYVLAQSHARINKELTTSLPAASRRRWAPAVLRAPRRTASRLRGLTGATGIAAVLNERGIPTATGAGEWYGEQVRRVLARVSRTITTPVL